VPAFANATKLGAYLGQDVDPGRADVLLDIASDAVRSKTRQRLDYVADETILLTPDEAGAFAFLPELPVIAVTAVSQLGRDGAWFDLAPDEYDWAPSGVLYRTRSQHWHGGWTRWTPRARSIRVTYSHGYDPIPGDLVAVVLGLAARLYSNPLGMSSVQLGAFHEQSGVRAPGLDFTDTEEEVLRSYIMARVG
jgi:hypothetical protein